MTQATSTFSSASGDGYELQMGRFARVLAPKFLDFLGEQDGGNFLDAGCGTGARSAELLSRGRSAEIVGVDISLAYVEHASQTITDPRARFEEGDLTNLRFADNSFDHTASQLVLMFIPEATKAVNELVRVTKPGGYISAAAWDFQGGLMFMRFVFDAGLTHEISEVS
jgi:ubiquinone/menaquinone biosynthesis C-methylase UbiE